MLMTGRERAAARLARDRVLTNETAQAGMVDRRDVGSHWGSPYRIPQGRGQPLGAGRFGLDSSQ